MKPRMVIALATASALLAVAVAVVLIVDRPINVLFGSRIRVFYYGGSIGCDYRGDDSVHGPREQISYGESPYIMNLIDVDRWRQSLPPATGWTGAGIAFTQRFHPRLDDNRNWSAAKYYLAVANAEYLIALASALCAIAFVAYLKTRRREKRFTAGLCAACGYDLRASGERCPECGSPAVASHAHATS